VSNSENMIITSAMLVHDIILVQSTGVCFRALMYVESLFLYYCHGNIKHLN